MSNVVGRAMRLAALAASVVAPACGAEDEGEVDFDNVLIWSRADLPVDVTHVRYTVRYPECALRHELDEDDERVIEWREALCTVEMHPDIADCEFDVLRVDDTTRAYDFVVGDYADRVFALGPFPAQHEVDCDLTVELTGVGYLHDGSYSGAYPRDPIVLRVGDPPAEL